MNIIEQATRRLEELRRSGIEVPAAPPTAAVPVAVEPTAVAKPPSAAIVARAKPRSHEPLVGPEVTIDLVRLAAMGYLIPETPRAKIADEFRVIKRPLLAQADQPERPDARSNLIMVTSSLPGEGKTFVSINLAISLSMEVDRTVLLVDADVSRPSVLKRLDLPPSPGLLDLLTDSSLKLPDVLLRTNIDNLAILPPGRASGRATELLASESMNKLLDELSARYPDRIVIFDAPPLLPSTESRALATHMGQVVLVVEAERTSHNTLAQAMGTLEGCPVVLPLLNKCQQSEVGSYYGYYEPL